MLAGNKFQFDLARTLDSQSRNRNINLKSRFLKIQSHGRRSVSLGLQGHGQVSVGSLWERSGISTRDIGGQLAEGQPWADRQLGTLIPLIFQVGKLRLWRGEVAPLRSQAPGYGSFHLSSGFSQSFLWEESATQRSSEAMAQDGIRLSTPSFIHSQVLREGLPWA